MEPLRDVLAFVESHIAPFIRAGDEYERGWHAAMHNVRNRLLEAQRIAAPPEGTRDRLIGLLGTIAGGQRCSIGSIENVYRVDFDRAAIDQELAELTRAAAGVHPPQDQKK